MKPELYTHLDDHGAVCTRHPTVPAETLLSLATVGSRAPGFHHDIASKLQGLMMAIDEISEGVVDNPDLSRAAETAMGALKDLNALLTTNRALTKPPTRTRVPLKDLVARATERVYVKLTAAVPDVAIEVFGPAIIHGLSLALDVAGGPGRGRTVQGAITVAEGTVTIALDASPSPPANASESLAIASFAIARDHGELRCTDGASHIVVTFPTVA